MPALTSKKFQQALLTWFKKHGRTTLPWQKNKTPYRVWLSEIMLQQTQVNTVIPYFERFMEQYPEIADLAKAPVDEVLHFWTGLGYYSRARNLHKTARIICEEFHGKFPDTQDALQSLPGIGRSTAGAILSIAFKKPAAILDGNVKRVLTRFYGITKWPGEKKIHDQLWKIAETQTPKKNPDAYAQAMMDLGATLCARGKPDCARCPFKTTCIAHAKGIEKSLPKSKPKKTLPLREATLFFIQHKHFVLLNKRPNKGIWGGLWAPIQIDHFISLAESKAVFAKQFNIKKIHALEPFRHTFTHFHLTILPIVISVALPKTKLIDDHQQIWYNLLANQAVGLPAPVKKLLRNLP